MTKDIEAPPPLVKFDLDPTDALFGDCHDFIDPDAPAVEEPRAPMGAQNFRTSRLASAQPPAPAEKLAEDMDLEAFLNDFSDPVK
ncbi:hypothetical protein [Streptomyces sp. GC420]|uniref:hypothetical protein n=1 Tax=Streptomyces sp. GC420 TaxID=2697568 RepID=UPI001414D5E4|nr:hypothetical protein [Streptomyces sp. GC420]NBM19536.1 hypothetical protein [Streptomyces sp. GC420]